MHFVRLTFGSNFVYQERRRNRNLFLYDTGIRRLWSFTICSLYPLERFGKVLFSCQVSAETERREPTWARLMVFGLRHEQQRSDLDVMQCIRLPVERDRLPAMQAGEAVCIKTRSSRAVRCESLALAGLLRRNTSWRNGPRTWATAQLLF